MSLRFCYYYFISYWAQTYDSVCNRESGSDYSQEEGEEYDELDPREEGQFWVTNDEPVERDQSPAYYPEEEEEEEEDKERPTPESVISLFAVGKLCR